MGILQLVLMILALVCLLLAALGVKSPRGDVLALGLFFWCLATIIAVK